MVFAQDEGQAVDSVWARKIIELVRQHPVLYDLHLQDYRDCGCCTYLQKHHRSARGRCFWYVSANYRIEFTKILICCVPPHIFLNSVCKHFMFFLSLCHEVFYLRFKQQFLMYKWRYSFTEVKFGKEKTCGVMRKYGNAIPD